MPDLQVFPTEKSTSSRAHCTRVHGTGGVVRPNGRMAPRAEDSPVGVATLSVERDGFAGHSTVSCVSRVGV